MGYHVPVAMALRLKLKNGKLHYNTDLEPNFNHYYRGITPRHEKKLITLLEDFYKKTDFHSFFKKIRPLYNDCKQAMQQQLVNKIDLDWIGTSRSLVLSTMSLSISISVC